MRELEPAHQLRHMPWVAGCRIGPESAGLTIFPPAALLWRPGSFPWEGVFGAAGVISFLGLVLHLYLSLVYMIGGFVQIPRW